MGLGCLEETNAMKSLLGYVLLLIGLLSSLTCSIMVMKCILALVGIKAGLITATGAMVLADVGIIGFMKSSE